MRKLRKSTWLTLSFMMMLFLVNFTYVKGQCTFNCNDTINVSVNSMCIATITPDIMLEGEDLTLATCSYAIQIFQEDGTTQFRGADVGMSEVGKTLKVKVFESGNPNGPNCWGYIKVEDKLPPVLVCAGSDTLPCFQEDPYYTNDLAQMELKRRIQSIGLVDNCNDQDIQILVLKNDLDRQFCQDGMSARRIINYNVLDNDRQVLNCQDTISYSQIPLDTLSVPTKRILNCDAPYPSVDYMLQRFGESSIPNFNGRALSEYVDSAFVEKERILCNFKMTYTDILFPTCGNTYKVVREWTVIDWCNSNFPRVINQIIKKEDTVIRIAGCGNINSTTADPNTCNATVGLPAPTTVNECSDWSFGIYVMEPGDADFTLFGSATRPSSSNVVNRAFPLGVSMVKYIVTDECGNTAECTYTVTVVDEEPPTAVCDYRTIVTLTDRYIGKVFAKAFDDESHDACSGIVSYKVRRTDRDNADCPTPGDYDDFVKFCCEDLGKTLFVELQVTDGAGLTSVCVVEVRVQFKGEGPQITCPLPIATQDCRLHDGFDITTLTAPLVTSSNPCLANNLTPSIREVGRDMNDCGVGYIDVEWFINLTGVEEVVCSERIEFENTNVFMRSDITWPIDRTITTCNEIAPTDSELESLIPADLQCSNVIASEPEDRRHSATSDACYRITRTWTVVDWCRYPADPSARWSYEQTLTIINAQEPNFNANSSTLDIEYDEENCRAQIRGIGIASDDCTSPEDLNWSYVITADGSIIIPSTTGNEVNLLLTLGTYKIEWNVTDECGNTTISEEEFTVADNQAPNIKCKTQEIVIDETTEDAVLIINDINDSSIDNCDASIEFGMRRDGSNDELSQLLRFDCQELGITEVELVGVDNAGLSGSCIAAVNVRNLNNVCDIESSAIGVSGAIFTMHEEAVENVEVQLSKATQNSYQQQMTNIDGKYAFEEIENNVSYQLRGRKRDDYKNGISTLDIILIQRHILGLKSFDTPAKFLAADINNNQSVSSTDIVLLRRLLLGHIDAFPNRDSWIFVDDEALGALEQNDVPWDLPMHVDISSVASERELTGIKIGDVDLNAIANSAIAKGRSSLTYSLASKYSESQDEIIVNVRSVEDLSFVGMQLGLRFDHSKVSFSGIESHILDISNEDLHIGNGFLKMTNSDNTSTRLVDGDNILTLRFKKKSKDVSYSDLDLNISKNFNSEIYNEDLEALNLNLIKDKALIPEVELLQNRPNPFSDHTLIEFTLPEQQEVMFRLLDLNGKDVFGFSQIFVPGRNQISISKQGLGLNKGIYYYQIRTQKRSLIKKMIIL